MAKLESALIIPDLHAPYHDARAFALMLKVGKALRPKKIVIMGDFMDCYCVSDHDKDPQRATLLKEELWTVTACLDQVDALGAQDKTFCGGNHCLSLDHRILSVNGWKGCEELQVGELVATRNTAGHLEWQPVKSIFRRAPLLGEQMYRYESRGLSLCVTDGHRVYGHANGRDWVKPAAECANTFDLPTSVTSGQSDYPLTDDEIRLAAWASTDVHYHTQGESVTFYQSEGKQARLEDLLLRLGIDYRPTARSRPITQICGKILKQPPKVSYEYRLSARAGREVRELTGLDRKGRLPAWVLDLSDRQWDIFLEELIYTDGTLVYESGAAVFYGKLSICEDVQIAAVTHGWRASISEYRPTHFRVNLVKATQCRVDGWKAAAEAADGEVWCIEVENQNFLTERHRKVSLTGNCDRLHRYLSKRAPALDGLEGTSIPAMLGLKERDWHYVPYKSHIKKGKVHFTHDVGTAGRYAAYKALDLYQHSVVTAHTHRMSYIVEGNATGEVKLSCTLGWLGDASQIDYMHKQKVAKDWALGFGVGYVEPTSGHWFIQPIPIVHYRCVVNGVLYTG